MANWSRVNDLFHRALEKTASERERFLDEACAGDTDLRAHVASLLSAHERAEGFMEAPPHDAAALLKLALDSGAPLLGETIGQYRILRTLGEGGMGIVYLAEDTRLGRQVALKALAPRHFDDPAQRERLRREARAAAALSHPGIATVFALEQFDDQWYIASEYVPGQTLRDELAAGAMTPSRVLGTALAIAQALEAAHARGIVHRDLKPENVIRSTAGQIKVLDFGLARLRDAGPQAGALTADGAMLGTPAYMSPEQIRGDAVDFRTDLFSLGVVMYELSSGVNPFSGSTPAATIARILETEPPPLESRALETIVRTCLRKPADARFASTTDLVSALEHAAAEAKSDRVPSRPGRSIEPPRTTESRAGRGPRWWWRFHQAAASVAYCAMLFPLWFVHQWTDGPLALVFFLLGLVAALVAGTLRLHLWFTVESYPAEWSAQRDRTAPWIRLADILFVTVLLLAAALVLTTHVSVAILLVGVAVASLLSFAIIEPATTRAAFRG